MKPHPKQARSAWRILALALAGLVLLAGCARNTIEKRRQERAAAYAGFPEEIRSLVDQGMIKVGMTPDAVYIAWGKPDQVLAAESELGSVSTWLYHDTRLESYRYWTTRGVHYKNHYGAEPYLAYDYQVRPYVSAEIIFEDGRVKEWRTFPYPVY